jgi:predicted glycosyltransferase involved in capsule biosynthesis
MRNKKIGVVVPFRNRYDQLDIFKERITKYLSEKDISYEIIIVEQDDAKLFNRGMLLNIGFTYAEKLKCKYVVFHDIDMLPIEVDYSYCETPLHLATNFLNNERELFDTYFGGVTMFNVKDFKKINGYSNKYWGWGYEDDDLLLRCIKNNLDLNTLYLNNMGTSASVLKFNGTDAYVKGINNFNLNNNITFFISFYPDDIKCNYIDDSDQYNIFTIHGYDFAISYNSFSRYNFCTFDENNNVLYVNSKIKKNYKTNIAITINNTEKIIKVYQDGELIGKIESFEKLHQYKKQPFFYIGTSDPNNELNPKYFKGYFDSLVVYETVLEDNEILEISQNKYRGLLQNFGNYNSADLIKLYYDSKFIKSYKLKDLSGNNNDGEIVNCEIVDLIVDNSIDIPVPHRRKSLFESLPHEENGFLDNKWKDQSTRWNQLRFINEVSTNHELLYNDGLSDLNFAEHGITNENNITFVTVGI